MMQCPERHRAGRQDSSRAPFGSSPKAKLFRPTGRTFLEEPRFCQAFGSVYTGCVRDSQSMESWDWCDWWSSSSRTRTYRRSPPVRTGGVRLLDLVLQADSACKPWCSRTGTYRRSPPSCTNPNFPQIVRSITT